MLIGCVVARLPRVEGAVAAEAGDPAEASKGSREAVRWSKVSKGESREGRE